MLKPSGTALEIRTGDLLVNYNETGEQFTTAIIFIHGFPFDKSMWDFQLEELGKKYRCIAYDLSGFGETNAREDFSIEQFADDLDSFMHNMQLDKAAVCGLSMGGYIALRAIRKYPERFSHLILCDTQCVADTDEGRQKRFASISQIESSGLEQWTNGFIRNVFTEASLAEKADEVEKIKKSILKTEPSSVTGTLKALAEREETCSILNTISVPALIICGKEDKITTPERAEFLRANIRNSSLVILEQAAHLSNLEQPGQFNQAIVDFLR